MVSLFRSGVSQHVYTSFIHMIDVYYIEGSFGASKNSS